MFILNKKNKKNSGITLIETIIYSVILLLVLFAITTTLGSLTSSHREALVNRLVQSSGSVAMEKMMREIRSAEAVNLGSSSLGVSPGALSLTGINEQTPYSVSFNLGGGILQVTKDGGSPGNLTSSATTITELIFERLTNSNSEGVRVTLEIQATVGNKTKTLELTDFAVLRGSY
ncbi:MAG: hypothetical protein AAB392_00845 [Patescibacteria group bacterium]